MKKAIELTMEDAQSISSKLIKLKNAIYFKSLSGSREDLIEIDRLLEIIASPFIKEDSE